MKKFIPIEQFLRENRHSPETLAFWKRCEEDGLAASKSEEPLLAEIRKLGFELTSVWDLVNFHTDYPPLIPLLVEHLGRDYHPKIKMAIARALIEPTAKSESVSRALVEELRASLPKEGGQWEGVQRSITLALSHIAHNSVRSDLEELEKQFAGTFLHEDLQKALRKCGPAAKPKKARRGA